jgi:transketolase
VRERIVDVFDAAGGGHYGGCMSVVEILVTLYKTILRVNPAYPQWADRDRLVLSKGHACGALCPVLSLVGFFEDELLDTFNKLDSPFGMHPDMHKIPGCDMSTGSLGHGLAVGIGMALSARLDGKDYRVYVVLGDGECQEGSVWEAAMVASHNKLNRLTAIVDRNQMSLDGCTEVLASLEPLDGRWRSFGWNVIEVDGHDFRDIHSGLHQARQDETAPTVLIAHTIKGRGVSFMEGECAFHYTSLTDKQVETARAEIWREI